MSAIKQHHEEFIPKPVVVEKLKNLVADKIKERLAKEGFPLRRVEASTGPKVGRNDLCPCGSGKKYKKCCLLKETS